jgi:ubiquinone/menaquinone biosynthesis C-methylase UbiE
MKQEISLQYLSHLRTTRFTADLELIRRIAQQAGSRVLELGSGTGRVMEYLNRLNFSTVGVEIDAHLIQEAKRRLPSALILHSGMQEFAIAESNFDLALIPFNTFEQVQSLDDRIKALRTIRRHLRKDGLLYIDTTPLDISLFQKEQIDIELPQIELETGTTAQVRFKANRNARCRRSDCTFEYRLEGSYLAENYSVFPLTDHELRLLLELTGYSIVGWWGSYSCEPYDSSSSDRLIALATAGNRNG